MQLIYRAFMRFLDREGVTLLEPEGQRFDPAFHEAVATVSHLEAGVAAQTVVEVVERGYILGDPQAGRLLQPARVIVAV